jgi:hypothetical protein
MTTPGFGGSRPAQPVVSRALPLAPSPIIDNTAAPRSRVGVKPLARAASKESSGAALSTDRSHELYPRRSPQARSNNVLLESIKSLVEEISFRISGLHRLNDPLIPDFDPSLPEIDPFSPNTDPSIHLPLILSTCAHLPGPRPKATP